MLERRKKSGRESRYRKRAADLGWAGLRPRPCSISSRPAKFHDRDGVSRSGRVCRPLYLTSANGEVLARWLDRADDLPAVSRRRSDQTPTAQPLVTVSRF